MIDRIIDFAIGNRLLVILFVLAVGALGVCAAQRLPIDAVPDVTNVQVQVLTEAPELGPLEIEAFITYPVESVMSGLPGVEELRSVSRFGLSAITVVFEDGTDIYRARQLVAERLQEARDAIPEDAGNPQLGPISSGLGEIYQFELRGTPMCAADGPDTDGCHTTMELRTILDWTVAYQLRSVPGVVEVNTFGGELETYEIELDPTRLTALRVPLQTVFEAVARNNGNAGGAYLSRAGEQYLIRGEGLVETMDDIRAIVVDTRADGTPITVADLGRVARAPMVRQGAVTRDGRGEAVIGIAMMLLGGNSRTVAQAVEERLDEIRPTLPPGVTIEPFYDRTELVDRTIRTVATNLIEGGVLVVVVLLLMLGNLRGGLLVASVIPLSMLAAFIAMDHFGVSGNLMSLGAIDFGLVVDGSVVVVENVVRTLGARAAGGPGAMGVVRQSAREVARPVVFAVAIIALVYTPIFSLGGVEGKMFRPMALTVIFALGASLVLALTWIPAMASVVFRRGTRERHTWLMRALSAAYGAVLEPVVRRPRVTAAVAGLVLAGSVALTPLLGAEFVPTLDEGALAIQAVRLPSVSLEQAVDATTRMERALLDHFPDEIVTVVSKTGRPEIATDPMGVDLSDVFVMLAPPGRWTRAGSKAELVRQMEAVLGQEVPGQRYAFSQPIELRTNELLSGSRSDVALSIYGDDMETLEAVGRAAARVLGSVPGAADVEVEQTSGLPFLRVIVDRQRVARYGVDAADVLDAVSAMGGRQVGEVFQGRRRVALQVRYPVWARDDVTTIGRIPIATPGGVLVPLGQLARVRVEDGPAQVSHHRTQRRLTVSANIRGRDLASFVAEAKGALGASGVVPPGYLVAWGGQFENLERASSRLLLAVPAALALILGLLVALFGSARPALIIYLNVPFAATGGVLALLARGMPLSISAAVGFIALFGVAVLDGVVMISHIRALARQGMDRVTAAVTGARDRLRPVLTTALVASLGFVPMAVARSAGAEVQRPLATVVIGGLISSTLLTLLVLPAMHAWLGGDGPDPDSEEQP